MLFADIPMTSNPDIWRAASEVLQRFGTDAAHVVSRQAERLGAMGDLDGRTVADDPEGC